MIDIDDRIDKLFPTGNPELAPEAEWEIKRGIKDIIFDTLRDVEQHFEDIPASRQMPNPRSAKSSVLIELRAVRRELGL